MVVSPWRIIGKRRRGLCARAKEVKQGAIATKCVRGVRPASEHTGSAKSGPTAGAREKLSAADRLRHISDVFRTRAAGGRSRRVGQSADRRRHRLRIGVWKDRG